MKEMCRSVCVHIFFMYIVFLHFPHNFLLEITTDVNLS